MGERRTRRATRLKKVFRNGVVSVVRSFTMGHGHSGSMSASASSVAGSTSPSSAALMGVTSCATPLRFHSVKGANVRVENNGARAERFESFCKGIVFSDRPVAIREKIVVKIIGKKDRWNGGLRIGFSAHNPASLNGSELPKYACPELTNRPGFWAKAVSDKHVAEGSVVHFYVGANGQVHFGINGQDRGVIFEGVDTRQQLWALMDLYGNCTTVELMDDRNNVANAAAVASAARTQELHRRILLEQQEYETRQQRDREARLEEMLAAMQIRPASSNGATAGAPSVTSSSSVATPTSVAVPPSSVDFLPVRYHAATSLRPLSFHFCTGLHARLSAQGDASVAYRLNDEFAQGYVFAASPVRLNERIVIQILATESEYSGSLAFGLTNCDPSTVDTRELPEDADRLIDRPEYWVVSRDVTGVDAPRVADELSFLVRSDGAVELSRNGQQPSVVMYVDASLRLWPFWDVYGNTARIRLLGTTMEPVITPTSDAPLPLANNTNNTSLPAPPTYVPNEAIPNDLGECTVCFERPVDCAIYTCGHMCMCITCAMKQWKGRGGGFCPICREPIRDIIRTFRA